LAEYGRRSRGYTREDGWVSMYEWRDSALDRAMDSGHARVIQRDGRKRRSDDIAVQQWRQ
jgi:hypothetical protein